MTAAWGRHARVVGLWTGAALCLVVVPAMLPQYPRFVVSLTLVNAVAAMGVNLSMGYAGQVSVGHAGFAAIGAYGTAILMHHVGMSFWLTLPLAAALAGVMGFLIGLPALRLNPLYIAMVTFGFGQVVSLISLNWIELTNGPNGLTLPPITLGEYAFLPHTFYWVIAGVFVVLVWVARNIARSRLGRCFIALRESELAAQAMGVHLAKYKTIALALGAAYGGISGSLYAGLSEFVNPDAFVFLVSILYLTMTVVGGMGTVTGPILGAVIFTVLPEILRPLAEYKEFVSGAFLLVFLVFMPRGLVGLASRARRRQTIRVDRPVVATGIDGSV